ncbi:pyruvate formate lyase family protein [Chloroflexota bacterium]
MVTAKEKRITEIMRENNQYYGSKGNRGIGRVLAGERDISRSPYREGITLDVERPRLIYEAYKATEGEPMVIRRAKALAHLLDNKDLYILPHEQIVGNITSRPNAVITYPELWWRWLDRAIDTDYRILLDSDEEREELHKIHQYFSKYGVHGMERNLLPDDIRPYWRYDYHGGILLAPWWADRGAQLREGIQAGFKGDNRAD